MQHSTLKNSSKSAVGVKDSIGFKLISIVFSFYFMITFTVTISHMYLDYGETKEQVIAELSNLGDVFAPGIGTSLWYDDQEQAISIVKGMLDVASIQGVRVENSQGELLSIGGSILDADGNHVFYDQEGKKQDISQDSLLGGVFSFTKEVTYTEDGESNKVGKMILFSSDDLVFQKVKGGFFYIIVGSILKTAALWLIFITVSRRILSSPLSQLVEATEQLDFDNLPTKEIKINTAGKNELKLLEVTFNKMVKNLIREKSTITEMTGELEAKNATLKDYSLNLEDKVAGRTAAIKELMDNSGQGFLSFGKEYNVHKECSNACQVFFNQPIVGENALQLIFPDNISSTKDLFDFVFSGTSSLDLLLDLLPKEIVVGERTLAIEFRWIPAQNKTGNNRIMVILTNITRAKKLEEQLKEDKKRNEMIIKIVTDQEGFVQFMEDTNQLFQSIERNLNCPLDNIDSKKLFRDFHTIKGGTASYNMTEIAEKAHQAEHCLGDLCKGISGANQSLIQQLKQETESIKTTFKHTVEEMEQFLPKEAISTKGHSFLKIPLEKLDSLESTLSKHNQLNDEIQQIINNLRKQPISNILNRYASVARELATKLGKTIEVVVKGESTEITYKKYDSLFSSLIHLIRNSVDHGIETQDIREMLGKPEKGTLEINAFNDSGYFHLIITDDGGGIDCEKVKQIAFEKQIITTTQRDNLNFEDSLKLIFSPGFSTKEEVTDISGRGVGLDAVNAVIAELNGTISISSEIEKGTSFKISIPEA